MPGRTSGFTWNRRETALKLLEPIVPSSSETFTGVKSLEFRISDGTASLAGWPVPLMFCTLKVTVTKSPGYMVTGFVEAPETMRMSSWLAKAKVENMSTEISAAAAKRGIIIVRIPETYLNLFHGPTCGVVRRSATY